MLFTLMIVLVVLFPSITSNQLRSNGVSLQQNCVVDVSQRKDCGYIGITQSICVNTNGCCWAQPPTGVSAPWCFYPGTDSPTASPTYLPTLSPTTSSPTVPTITPSFVPSIHPTIRPTLTPSAVSPSRNSTSIAPSVKPSFAPTAITLTDSLRSSGEGNKTAIITSIIIVGLIVLAALAFVSYSFCHIYGHGYQQPPQAKEEKKIPLPVTMSESKPQEQNYVSFYNVSDKFKFNRRDLMMYHTETEDSIDDFDTDFKSMKWYTSKDHEFSN